MRLQYLSNVLLAIRKRPIGCTNTIAGNVHECCCMINTHINNMWLSLAFGYCTVQYAVRTTTVYTAGPSAPDCGLGLLTGDTARRATGARQSTYTRYAIRLRAVLRT